MAWRSEAERQLHQAERRVYTSATMAATDLAAFPVQVEAYVWRAVRAGLDLDFEETNDEDGDNDLWQEVVCDLDDTSPGAVLMRERLVRIANSIARDLHNHPLRLHGDDAPLGWMLPPQLHEAARRRVLRAWERLDRGEDVSQAELSEAATYRLLDAKGRAIRAIIDRAIVSVGVIGVDGPRFRFRASLAAAFSSKRKKVVERTLSRRQISDGVRTLNLVQVRAWSRERERAELCAKLEGLHQVADSRGYVSLAATITLPAEFHHGGRSPEEQRQAIADRVAAVRAILSEVHAPMTVDSFHPDRASAYDRRDAIRADSHQAAKANLVETADRRIDGLVEQAGGMRWVVLAAERLGRDALGAIFCEPHEDGTPHLHVAIRCDASIADVLTRRLKAIGRGAREVLVEVRDGAEGRKATNYGGKHALRSALRDDEEAEAVRTWCRDLGLRQVRWIGLAPMTTAWRSIFGADLAEIAVERAQIVKTAMQDRRWGDALSELGTIRSTRRHRPAMRLVYEDDAPDIGTRRRAIGVMDPLHPEQGVLPLRPAGAATWAQTAGAGFGLSEGVSDPRAGSDLVDPDDPPDPVAWLDAAE